MNELTLNNHVRMPVIGYGTWDVRGEAGKRSILTALDLGYRLIDTEETSSSASDDSAYYYTPFDSVTEGTGKEDGTGLFHSASSGQSGH